MRNMLFFVLALLLLCGCGIFQKEPYIKVSYFDIGSPAAQDIGGKPVLVGGVDASRPYLEKMVFRVSENRIEIDEYNRWSCSSADMLQKYLSLAYETSASNEKLPVCLLKVEIFQIEADIAKSSAKLVLQASIEDRSSGKILIRKTYSEEIPVGKVTGESFAKGIAAAAAKILEQLTADIRKSNP
ncbi:MAG: ABC-type transport auxiliary lipoprotein family protein [Victivallales bacterium]